MFAYSINVGMTALAAHNVKWRGRAGLALLCSLALHGLVLPLIWTGPARTTTLVIPLDIVMLADETAGSAQPEVAPVPQQQAGQFSTPAVEPAGITPSPKPPDQLEIKLHALANLRQPSLDTHLAEKQTGLSRLSAMSTDAAPGPYATYAVRDFIRVQVERRWGLDLPT
jgi:hypothetical protein